MSKPVTPIVEDLGATVGELLERAAADYARAEDRREQVSHEDRVHGHAAQVVQSR